MLDERETLRKDASRPSAIPTTTLLLKSISPEEAPIIRSELLHPRVGALKHTKFKVRLGLPSSASNGGQDNLIKYMTLMFHVVGVQKVHVLQDTLAS